MIELIVIFLISMVPVFELRGSIPLALALTDINPIVIFSICVALNVLMIPLVFKGLDWLAPPLIKRSKVIRSIFAWFRRRSYDWKLGLLGLATFVAVPLPGTGAFTGTVIAYMLKMDRKHATLAIAAGVIAAGIMVLFGTLGIMAVIKKL
jgi:uncharacterized membrane protein